MHLVKSAMFMGSLFRAEPTVEFTTRIDGALSQLGSVSNLGYVEEQALKASSMELFLALSQKCEENELHEKVSRKHIHAAMAKLLFGNSCILNNLPDTQLNYSRLYYWNIGEPRELTAERLRNVCRSFNGHSEGLRSQQRLYTDACTVGPSSVKDEDDDKVRVMYELTNAYGLRSAYDGIELEHIRQNLHRGSPRDQFERTGKCFLICKLQHRWILIALMKLGQDKQPLMIIIDPTNTQITEDSDAWKTIVCAYRNFIGEPEERSGLVGLENVHNSCFANAAMQALLGMRRLNGAIGRGNFEVGGLWHCYKKALGRATVAGQLGCPLVERDFAYSAWSKLHVPLYTQQCPAELLQQFFGDLVNECANEEQREEISSQFRIIRQRRIEHESFDRPRVYPLETISLLEVNMKRGDREVYDCLRRIHTEPDADRAPFRVDEDSAPLLVRQGMRLQQTSKYLILYLVRFGVDPVARTKSGGPVIRKLYNRISFPLEGFNISSLMEDPGRRVSGYKCIAIIMHRGPYGAGHYTAYRRDESNNWYYFDDAYVGLVTADEIGRVADLAQEGSAVQSPREATPYLLVYEQEEAPADASGPSAASAALPPPA
jgi:Ubiquitin carboxyl-terminal hydrolase